MPQNSIKNIFGFLTISLIRTGLMIWLGAYFQAYIPPTCGPLCIFLNPFGGAKMPQESYHLVVFGHFSWKNGPNDLVRGL
jgi:hypothetical protein